MNHRDPTVTELRVVDTYWSDHCRHTTFLTNLEDIKIEDPEAREAFDAYLALRREVYGDKAGARPITLMDVATIAARRLIETGAVARGQAAFASLMKDTAMDDTVRHAAQLELAHTLMGARRYAEARAQYEALAADGGATPSLRARANLLALRALVREGKVADAVKGYRATLARRDMPLSVRYEADEALKGLAKAGRARTTASSCSSTSATTSAARS